MVVRVRHAWLGRGHGFCGGGYRKNKIVKKDLDSEILRDQKGKNNGKSYQLGMMVAADVLALGK